MALGRGGIPILTICPATLSGALHARRDGARVRGNGMQLLRGGGERTSYEAIEITKNLIISAAITPYLAKKLDEYCHFWGYSRSEVIREALELILWIDPRASATTATQNNTSPGGAGNGAETD